MRILSIISMVIGALITFVGFGYIWLAFRVRDALAQNIAASTVSPQQAFSIWMVGGEFYLFLGVTLLATSFALYREFSWAIKTWLLVTTALAAMVAMAHFLFSLGSLYELLGIGLLAAVGWFFSHRASRESHLPPSPKP